jgi:hypothetical protein
MATPLITPAMLTSRAAGLSWNVVPTLTANTEQQLAALWNVCWNATSAVDSYVHQPLRATVITEQWTGPGGPRISVSRDNGIATLITRRWPVTQILAIQTSPARSFPPCWTLIPPGQYQPRHPVLMDSVGPATGPSGGWTIDVAPCFITWDLGRMGLFVSGSIGAGWPHAGLTGDGATIATGDTPQTIAVDDVTGWAGWNGVLYDGTFTEQISVTAVSADSPLPLPGLAGTAQVGPGTLTLASPLQYDHAGGAVVSAMPADVLHAAALHAAVEALETIDAIATQSLNGQMAGGTGVLAESAELKLDRYVRVA